MPTVAAPLRAAQAGWKADMGLGEFARPRASGGRIWRLHPFRKILS
jgi:hypothetical protein